MAIISFAQIESSLAQIRREIGELRREDRLIRQKMSYLSGSSSPVVFSAAEATGYVLAGAGLSGGGGLPGTVSLEVDLHDTWSGLEFDGGELRIDLDATYNAWTAAHYHDSHIYMANATTLGVSGGAYFAFSNSPSDVIRLGGGDLDIDGNDIILDADGDTSINATSDDRIQLVAATVDGEIQALINGVADVRITSGELMLSTATDLYIYDASYGIRHGAGNTAGYVLRGDGTRYLPAQLNMDDLAATNLVDPDADRILFWDDSDSQYEWLTPAAGVTISTNALRADIADLTENASPASNDWVMVENNAGGTLRKVQVQNIGGGIGVTPTGQGSILITNATPDWIELVHPGAAYRHLESTASTLQWVQNITLVSSNWIGLGASSPRLEFQSSGNALDLYSGCNLRLYSDAGSTLTGNWNAGSGALNAEGNITVNTDSVILSTSGVVTIDQGANDDEIFLAKSSDVSHGVTDETDDDAYLFIKKWSSDIGGAHLVGLTETAVGTAITGIGAVDSANKNTSANAYVVLRAAKKSGATISNVGTDANLVVIRDYNTSRFFFDKEGSAHADIEWTTFDEYDDVALLSDLESAVLAHQDPVKDGFMDFLKYNRDALERARIVSFGEEGHAVVNFTKLSMLLVGAIRQLSGRLNMLESGP